MLNEIAQCIVEGVKSAYDESLMLTDAECFLQDKVTEYLFTVNVAQHLLRWRLQSGVRGLGIHLEYSADDFKNNTFPQRKWKSSAVLHRLLHSVIREGRIDIALLSRVDQLSLRSLVGIELKAIDPNIALVGKDVLRLADAIQAKDAIAENSIAGAFIAFVDRLDTKAEIYFSTEKEERINARKAELKRYLESWLGQTKLKWSVSFFDCFCEGADEIARRLPEEIHDAGDMELLSGVAIGTCITLTPSNAAQ